MTLRLAIVCLTPLALAACWGEGEPMMVDPKPLEPTVLRATDEMLSKGIQSIPGTICVADADGKCDPHKWLSGQCLSPGSNIVVDDHRDHPTYIQEIDVDSRTIKLNESPFINPLANVDDLDMLTVEALVSAEIQNRDGSMGYPGIEGIRACLAHFKGSGYYAKVYWISSARVLDAFHQLSNKHHVPAGPPASDYRLYQERWIGLQASLISVGQVDALPLQPDPVTSSFMRQ